VDDHVRQLTVVVSPRARYHHQVDGKYTLKLLELVAGWLAEDSFQCDMGHLGLDRLGRYHIRHGDGGILPLTRKWHTPPQSTTKFLNSGAEKGGFDLYAARPPIGHNSGCGWNKAVVVQSISSPLALHFCWWSGFCAATRA
jgi:hypothetical protein